MTYHLPPDYVRQQPERFFDEDTGIVWQPDVYPFAFDLARELGRSIVVDVGCGYGRKLQPYTDEFTIYAIDLPGTLAKIEAPGAVLVAHDLDSEDHLPVGPDSLVICSDVIEHLWHPERLLSRLIAADVPVVLSTPDRERTHGAGNLTPTNVCHAQEWTLTELVCLLHDLGAEPDHVGWTRSHGSDENDATCLVTFGGPL